MHWPTIQLAACQHEDWMVLLWMGTWSLPNRQTWHTMSYTEFFRGSCWLCADSFQWLNMWSLARSCELMSIVTDIVSFRPIMLGGLSEFGWGLLVLEMHAPWACFICVYDAQNSSKLAFWLTLHAWFQHCNNNFLSVWCCQPWLGWSSGSALSCFIRSTT